jgi:poly(A) polymerase/tRNA nucleotidyltransferase (CCA-adding enzyme)
VKGALRDWALLREPAVRAVLDALDGDSRSTRIVGGAVRDALLDRHVTDADLATVLTPQDVISRAGKAGLKTVPTGIDHGTVTVIAEGRPFQVTTLRRDIETDGRHAVVHFTTDWEKDAARRDFTMNALYCDVAGEVLDPLGGIADLKAGNVRFIGRAEDRIREDYLRILRFFRFFAWYGKGRPDPDGLKACAKLQSGIATLSAERVWAELKRLLEAPDPARALLWMRTSEVLQKTLPESWGIDAIHRLVAAEKSEGWQPDPLFRLESILPPHRARIDALIERLRLSKAEAVRLLAWADAPEADPEISEADLSRTLYRSGREGFRDRLRHALARELDKGHDEAAAALRNQLRFLEAWSRPIFPVSGKDLLVQGLEGVELGRRLKALEERWVESGFAATREELLAGK